MRLNNLSARLVMNKWLADHSLPLISADATYQEFASELRARLAKGQVQVPFVSRPDAVRYIRLMAAQCAAEPHTNGNEAA